MKKISTFYNVSYLENNVKIFHLISFNLYENQNVYFDFNIVKGDKYKVLVNFFQSQRNNNHISILDFNFLDQYLNSNSRVGLFLTQLMKKYGRELNIVNIINILELNWIWDRKINLLNNNDIKIAKLLLVFVLNPKIVILPEINLDSFNQINEIKWNYVNLLLKKLNISIVTNFLSKDTEKYLIDRIITIDNSKIIKDVLIERNITIKPWVDLISKPISSIIEEDKLEESISSKEVVENKISLEVIHSKYDNLSKLKQKINNVNFADCSTSEQRSTYEQLKNVEIFLEEVDPTGECDPGTKLFSENLNEKIEDGFFQEDLFKDKKGKEWLF